MDDLRAFEATLAAVVADGGQHAPRRICELCLVALPVTGAAITVMTDADHQSPVWASDDVATRLAELQFRLGEGPSLQAFATGRPVLVADLADPSDPRVSGAAGSGPRRPGDRTDGTHDSGMEIRWPLFAAAAARETPARAMQAWPLRAGEIRLGVLDFYRDRPGALADDDLVGAGRAADAAFWSLLGMRRAHVLDADGTPRAPADGVPVDGFAVDGVAVDGDGLDGGPTATGLERREVYQATGMLIAQLGVSADAALARLRAYAFVHDRPLDEVAHDVVERRLRLDPDPA